MMLNSVNIKSLGMFVVDFSGMEDLQKRKHTLDETGIEEKDIKKESTKVKIELCGEYDTASSLKTNLAAFYSELDVQPISFEMLSYSTTFTGYVVDGVSTKVEALSNKFVLWLTFKVRV